MMLGHVRDGFPRLVMPLPSARGSVQVEFILDTGFDGELALPHFLLQQLDVVFAGNRAVRLADGTQLNRPYYIITFAWNNGLRQTEVIGLEGQPLIGVELLAGFLIQIEMQDGGEVSMEEI